MKPTLPEPTIVSCQTNSAMRTMEVRSYSAHEVQRLIDEAYEAGLEDAAKECDERLHAGDVGPALCASAIRALKGK